VQVDVEAVLRGRIRYRDSGEEEEEKKERSANNEERWVGNLL